jgi:hypothetical protein
LKAELKDEWAIASTSKTKDAKLLFQAVDKMLAETANTEWQDLLAKRQQDAGLATPKTTWEEFRQASSQYIRDKVLPDDAYDQQRTYMMNRTKPRQLDAKEWKQRLLTLNRYLPYFLSFKELKEKIQGAD